VKEGVRCCLAACYELNVEIRVLTIGINVGNFFIDVDSLSIGRTFGGQRLL
jgi:hypothetical protein